jgi:hypothetical protein
VNKEDWPTFKGFWKNSKVKEGSRRQCEYCASHKSKNQTKLIFSGHQVIKNENGFERFKTFQK